MRKAGVLAALALAVGGIVFWGGPYVGMWGVRQIVRERLDLSIEGQYTPVWGQMAFRIRSPEAVWEDRVRFQGGEIRVDYHFPSWKGKKLYMDVSGHSIQVEFLNAWDHLHQGPFPLSKLQSSILVGQEGLEDIHRLDVESPVFEFHFGAGEARV